jgi:hypothetical protein
MLIVLLYSVILVIVITGIHLMMLRFIFRFIPRLKVRWSLRMAVVVLIAIFTHIIEITLFAAVMYLLVTQGGHGYLEGQDVFVFSDYIYYTAVTYTTIGYGDITPEGTLRFYVAILSLTGLVMIAWTASGFYVIMQRHWEMEDHLIIE